jgi:hypothetical protein
MNLSSAQSKAKKRLQGIFSLYKNDEKDLNNLAKSEENKEYTVAIHDISKYEVKKRLK